MAARKKAKPKSRPKSRRDGVVQPHGGVLVPGAGRGPAPGAPNAGRPPSLIRKDLLRSFDDRRKFLDAVVDGELLQRIEVSLAAVVPHVKCATCPDGGKIVPKEVADLFLVTFEARASANVKDRLAAHDMQAKYSLGVIKGIMADTVREKVQQSLDAIRGHVMPDQYQTIANLLRPIWAGGA